MHCSIYATATVFLGHENTKTRVQSEIISPPSPSPYKLERHKLLKTVASETYANRRGSRITAKKKQKHMDPNIHLLAWQTYYCVFNGIFFWIRVNADLYHNLSCKCRCFSKHKGENFSVLGRNRCRVNVALVTSLTKPLLP